MYGEEKTAGDVLMWKKEMNIDEAKKTRWDFILACEGNKLAFYVLYAYMHFKLHWKRIKID